MSIIQLNLTVICNKTKKKHSEAILLTPPAGSTYWKNGTFEITKTDSEQSTTNKTVPTNNPHYNALQQYQAATFQTNLSVTLPNDLLGTSRIKVAVKQVNGLWWWFVGWFVVVVCSERFVLVCGDGS